MTSVDARPHRATRLGTLLLVGVVTACVAGVLAQASFVNQRLDFLATATVTRSALPGQAMPRILPDVAFDGYMWIRHAQDMVVDGDWRLRTTHVDNAPFGRDVHWHSGFAWWLIALGQVHHLLTSTALTSSIDVMAPWANTIVLVLALLLIPWLTSRRFGIAAGALVAVAMLGSGDFFEGFLPGYPDHHGEIAALSLLALVCLLSSGCGWLLSSSSSSSSSSSPSSSSSSSSAAEATTLLPATRTEARRWVTAAAVAGGALMWVSAAQHIVLLIGVGMAALLGALAAGRGGTDTDAPVFDGELWSHWGRVGAAASLALYVLEYFPHHLGMQLLANHPLHALAWLGAGEVLAVTTTMAAMRRWAPSRRGLLRLLLGLACVSLFPLAIFVGGADWYVMLDPFEVALLKEIMECRPLLPGLVDGTIEVWSKVGVTPAIVPVTVLLLLVRGRRAPTTRALLLMGLVPAVVVVGMRFYQVRWGLNCGAPFIASLAVVVGALANRVPGRWGTRWPVVLWLASALALLAVHPRDQLKSASRQARAKTRMIIEPEARHLVMRDIALTIRADAGDADVVVLASPNATLLTTFFGGFSGVGTLYWENLAGLKAAAAIFTAPTDDIARRLLRQHGVTHIVFTSWEDFIEPFFRLTYRDGTAAGLHAGFAWRVLFAGERPTWLREVAYPTSPMLKHLGMTVLIFRVDDGVD